MIDEKLDEELKATEVETEDPIDTKDGEGPSVDIEAKDETIVTFGDDEALESKDTPGWVKDLRKRNRELNKEKAALQKQIDAGNADDTTALGAEPTLEDCDYDADSYRDSLRKYDANKAKIDAMEKNAQAERDILKKAYDDRLGEYHEGRGAFDADSFDEAESAVKDVLNETQQSILIKAFGNKAAPLIAGLGKDEKRLKALSKISDPIEFTVAVTRLESAMKISSRKPKTVPETRVAGNASAVSGDNQLEKLREDAAKTGDMSKVLAYKRRLKAS